MSDPLGKSHSGPITREDLYNKVWSQPMLAVAKEFGVSSSYLARVCSRMNIPRPERGHWAKLSAGKKVHQPPLPPAEPYDELEWTKEGSPLDYSRERPRPKPTPPKRLERSLAFTSGSVHRMVRESKDLFLIGSETETGYLKPKKKLLLDLIVSRQHLENGLKLFNRILLGLEQYNYKTVIAPYHEYLQRRSVDERDKPNNRYRLDNFWSPGRPTVVYVGSVALGLTLFELSTEKEVIYKDGRYALADAIKKRGHHPGSTWTTTRNWPSGKFCLQVYSPYGGTTWHTQWRIDADEEFQKFIERLAKELTGAASEVAQQVEDARIAAEREMARLDEMFARMDREEKERKRLKAIKDSKDELLAVIEKWNTAKAIYSFFAELESALTALPSEQQEILKERITNAKKLIECPDALDEFMKWKAPDER